MLCKLLIFFFFSPIFYLVKCLWGAHFPRLCLVNCVLVSALLRCFTEADAFCRFQGKARLRKQSDSGGFFCPPGTEHCREAPLPHLQEASKSRMPVGHREFRYVLALASRTWPPLPNWLPFLLRSKYRCHGSARGAQKSALELREDFWCFPLIAHSGVFVCILLSSSFWLLWRQIYLGS